MSVGASDMKGGGGEGSSCWPLSDKSCLDLSEEKNGTIEGFLAEEWGDLLCFEKIPFDC